MNAGMTIKKVRAGSAEVEDKMAIMDMASGGIANLLGFILNFSYVLVFAGIMLAIMSPFLFRYFFPIPFIVYKNAGGAKGNDTVILYKKIIRRGRLVNTKYGQRVKIWGLKDTMPLTILSRDNAMPWEGGGVAFIIYEKEVGQLFPVDPHLKNLELLEAKNKDDNEKIQKVYTFLINKFPDLTNHFRIVNPKRATVISPVLFANASVKLQPIPVDMITSYSYDQLARVETYMKQGFWEKYGAYVVATSTLIVIIIVTVLSYNQVDKTIDDRLAELGAGSENIAERVFQKMTANQGAPPGGNNQMFFPFPLLPFLNRRWKYATV
jgi:hypothetical protein